MRYVRFFSLSHTSVQPLGGQEIFIDPSPLKESIWGPTESEKGITTMKLFNSLSVVFTVPCRSNFTGPEGYIESPRYSSLLYYTNLDCSYAVTVFMGYGVEIQVSALLFCSPQMVCFIYDRTRGKDV